MSAEVYRGFLDEKGAKTNVAVKKFLSKQSGIELFI